MKNIKFLIALSAIVFVFAACNSCNQSKVETKKQIRIGAILPLTGDAANYGNGLKKGWI